MKDIFADRLPPYSHEAEQAVIGSVILDPAVLTVVNEHIQAEDFYRQSHIKLYRTINELSEKGSPLDLVTLTAELQNKQILDEVGGVVYLTELSNTVPTAANAHHYAKIVEEKSILRNLIRTATQIAANGYQGVEEVHSLINNAEKKILEISQKKIRGSFVPIKEVLLSSYELIEELHNNKKGLNGVPTGFTDLDRMTSGLKESELIIIAARPSMGKTALALNIVQNVAIKAKKSVAMFNLEMSATQLALRMLAAEGNINAEVFRSGQVKDDDWEKITLAMGVLGDSKIFIDDTPGITIYDIRAKLRRLKIEHGLDLVVIDYLQLIETRGNESRQQEISEISRSLKLLARELNVPVIALSQLSRAVEQRQDKRPMLSDLRESGSIEQDADIVAFLYRDDYYNEDSDKKNIAEVIIGKQRNGPTGKIELLFLKNYNKFLSLEINKQDSEPF